MLTSYDLSSKTVVMPAGEVEEEVGNALGEDSLTLAAVDESEVGSCGCWLGLQGSHWC